jgi:ketosteroid isomerase-like protein
MSKRLTLALIFILSGIAACTPTQSKTPVEVSEEVLNHAKNKMDVQSSVKAIETVMDQQAKDWNNGDIDGFMTGYWHSDSLKFITKNGIRMGYDSVTLNYKKSYDSKDKMGRLNFSDLNISMLDQEQSIANVTGKWEVIQKNKTLSGIFSLVFRQVKGEWKIVIDHTW